MLYSDFSSTSYADTPTHTFKSFNKECQDTISRMFSTTYFGSHLQSSNLCSHLLSVKWPFSTGSVAGRKGFARSMICSRRLETSTASPVMRTLEVGDTTGMKFGFPQPELDHLHQTKANSLKICSLVVQLDWMILKRFWDLWSIGDPTSWNGWNSTRCRSPMAGAKLRAVQSTFCNVIS